MDMRLVILLEEVKEQVRVTVPPLTTLTSAGATTEIQHTLLSSTDTQRHQREGVQSLFTHTNTHTHLLYTAHSTHTYCTLHTQHTHTHTLTVHCSLNTHTYCTLLTQHTHTHTHTYCTLLTQHTTHTYCTLLTQHTHTHRHAYSKHTHTLTVDCTHTHPHTHCTHAAVRLKVGVVASFTFMHLADAFAFTIAFRLYIFNQCMCSRGIEPSTFCAADAMLYH